jgi:hypothetical protein
MDEPEPFVNADREVTPDSENRSSPGVLRIYRRRGLAGRPASCASIAGLAVKEAVKCAYC